MTDSYQADVFVGEYRVEGVIGHGGMGVVYAAVHPVIGKRAAIKILRHDQCASAVAVERFVDEARIVNTIGHPNIVDIFAIGMLPDGRSYLVMELLEGETLHDRITRGPLAVADMIEIVRPLARALDAAHMAGVVHRDLKPDNIFLVSDAQGDVPAVKLLDFGIAKLANNDHRANHTATGSVMGTPMYLSPEQANGSGVDRRADIYALGCIMFEMLTGRAPFIGDSALAIITKHLMESPVRPSIFAPHIPAELDDLVFAMLAKDPGARPSLMLVQSALSQMTGLARGSQRAVATAMWGGSNRALTPPLAPRTVKGTPPPPMAQSHDAPTIMINTAHSSSGMLKPSLIPTPRSLTPTSLRRPKRSPIWFVLAMAIALGTIAFALAYWISAGTG